MNHIILQFSASSGGNWLFVVLGAVITLAGQWLLHEYRRWQEKRSTEEDKLKLLRSELEDLVRHCARNLQVLNAIDLTKGIPSDFHFQKMKVLETSFIFNSDIYSQINKTYSRKIHELRKKVHNLNLEIEACVSYLNSSKLRLAKVEEYIQYLKNKMIFTINSMPEAIQGLSEEKWESKVNSLELINKASKAPPFPLIYK